MKLSYSRRRIYQYNKDDFIFFRYECIQKVVKIVLILSPTRHKKPFDFACLFFNFISKFELLHCSSYKLIIVLCRKLTFKYSWYS